jgi:seryl-tRNA synthetase
MLDIKHIRTHTEAAKASLANTGADPSILDNILEVDEQRRQLQQEGDALRADMNVMAKNIGREKDPARKSELISQVGALKKKIKSNQAKAPEVEKTFQDLMLSVPNIPLDEVPVGESEEENESSTAW